MFQKSICNTISFLIILLLFPLQVSAENLAGDVMNFDSHPGDQFNVLTWENPENNDFAGTMIIRSTEQIAWEPSDGIIYHSAQNINSTTTVIYYSTGEEYKDNPLENGNTYYYQAFTVDYDVNYSDGSLKIESTPADDSSSPHPPSNLSGMADQDNINLSWNFSDSDDVRNYHLICIPNNAYSSNLETYTTYNSHQFSSAIKNVNYSCNVTAIDYSDNISEPSNNITIKLESSDGLGDDGSGDDGSGDADSGDDGSGDDGSGDDGSGDNGSGDNGSGDDGSGDDGSGDDGSGDNGSGDDGSGDDGSGDDGSGDDGSGDDGSGDDGSGDDGSGDGYQVSNLSPPYNLIFSNSHRSVSINWEMDSSYLVIGYNSYKKCSSDNEYLKANIQIIPEKNTTISDLPANDICSFYITAVDNNLLETIPSEKITTQIIDDTDNPSEIENIEIITGNNQVFLSWDRSSDADLKGYNIYLNGNLVNDNPTSNSQYTITDIKNNTENSIEIRAVDTAGNESSFQSYSFITPSSHPYNEDININSDNLKTALLLSQLSTTLNENGVPVISLNNNDPNTDNDDINNEINSITNLAGFNIYRGTNIGDLEKINHGYLINEMPYQDNTSSSQTIYYYQVVGVSLDGLENERSNIITITSKDSRNNGYFLDVPSGHTFFQYVEDLRINGIVQGYPGHIYKPDQPITRIEALKIILKTQGIITDNSLRFHDYADIDKNEWYSEYIQTASLESIVKGYEDGYFRPNKNVTRIEFLKMVMKTAGLKNTETYGNFLDLDNNFWGTDYANTAQSLGIISGYADGNFMPNKDITRAEAAKIVGYLLRK